jgi:glyoxylase-like metal-dependent hydrolase (beta-lactamase superfamily II)
VPGCFTWGGHGLERRRLSGHTEGDWALLDHSTGVLFSVGLVFADRVPTTPHARLPTCINSLKTLREWVSRGQVRTVVPSHRPVHTGTHGVDHTLDWLQWLSQRLEGGSKQGLDLTEVWRLPLPDRFAKGAAQAAEFVRSVMGLYPAHKLAQLQGRSVPTGTAR